MGKLKKARRSGPKSRTRAQPVKPSAVRPQRQAPPSAAGVSATDDAAVPEDASALALAPGARRGFPIVGIGASAGGLEALEELLGNMPIDTGMAFVVVTHQHPGHASLLPELLAKTTELPVLDAQEGSKVAPNHVYVVRPGAYLAILQGVLHRMETGDTEAPRLPIDYFFRSLAEDQRERAICVILSGTGTDGTLGLKAIKGESGMAVVQQAQSARYPGMPASAVATGLADYILPPAEMPRQLVAYAKGPYLTAQPASGSLALPDEPLQRIFILLRSRTGHDFSSYKASTIRRRIERRMNLHQIKGPNQYVRFLQENPHEIDILFKELLISVTSFFRDGAAFEALASALPELLRSRPDNYALRVWVPGCASGEEVYSLAIALRECMDAIGRHLDVQIFGTDLDSEAIEAARTGLYPDGIAVDVSPARLERHFVREDAGWRIRKDVRDMVIFATQNVIKDPPFTKLDLISCRNLLIYLNSGLQAKLLPLFQYALKPGGLLFLGPSETIGSSSGGFDALDAKWKLFRRRESVMLNHPALEFPIERGAVELVDTSASASRPAREPSIVAQAERLLLSRFAPASVVANDRGDIVYIHGRTGQFLEPTAGQPKLNIVEMAREGLQLELASALREAVVRPGEVTREDVRVKTNGDYGYVNVSVTRINEPEALRGLLLVSLRLRSAPAPAGRKGKPGHNARKSARVIELTRELQATKQSLQTTIEELETSNEELKSANEELQSTNEELQSTNEELETSKEELQSLNEELTTVNNELESKVEELSRSNDDMQNLLNSTEIATVFLDNELNIKRYTEQAKRLVNLIQTDVGRPLADLASRLDYDALIPDCREVLRTLVFRQAEVRTKDGHWHLMRVMPYRTAENVIDGLVLTFVDINPVKEAQTRLRRISKVFVDGQAPVVIVDLAGRILDFNDEALRAYGWSRDELAGQSLDVITAPAGQQELAQRLERCRAGELQQKLECVRVTKAGRELTESVVLSLLTDEHGVPDAISMVAQPVRT